VAETWHSPRSRSAAVAAAPARLAEQCDGYAVWRQAPDGTLEIATLKDGRLTRHLVHDDGTTTALESFDSSAGSVFGQRLTWAGFAICVLIVASGAILAPAGVSDRRAMVIFPAFLIGMALAAIGGTMREHRSDPRWLLRRLGDNPAEWQIPSRLNGWQPASSEQLAAVEELAEEHDDGVAYVRDNGGATIQALVLRKRRVDSYWIDRLGNVGLSETLPSRFPGTLMLARRVRKLPDASAWIEIRTRPEPTNDA
jgi:hypothetical protein